MFAFGFTVALVPVDDTKDDDPIYAAAVVDSHQLTVMIVIVTIADM